MAVTLAVIWMFATTDSTAPWLLWWSIGGTARPADAAMTTGCPARNYSLPLVVVMPLIASQAARLQENMRLWTQPAVYPCAPYIDSQGAMRNDRPTLAIYFDRPEHDDAATRAASIALQDTLAEDALSRMLRTCFSQTLIMSANMSAGASRNTGRLGLRTSLWSTEGSNAQWESALQHFGEGERFRHMWWMEPDTWPLRRGWLDAVVRESTWGDFWVRGSPMRYQPRMHVGWEPFRTRYLRHMNGNALYALNDQCFAAFRRVAATMFPGKAFDVAMMFALLDVRAIMRFQSVAFRFQYSRVVADASVARVDRDTALREYPGTYLVHGKNRFLKGEAAA